MKVRARDQISTTLRDIIRKPPHHRRILQVRQILLIAVGFITGCHEDSLQGTPTGSQATRALEYVRGTHDIHRDGLERLFKRDSNDSLRSQVKNEFNFLL